MRDTRNYYFFHGLFGENIDLCSKFKIDTVDTYTIQSLDEIPFNPNSVLLGYSLGGRVLLRLLEQKGFDIKCNSVHLISTHFGLTANEISTRIDVEQKIIANLYRNKINDFWNSLELFSNDTPIIIDEEKADFYRHIFTINRLSKQKNYIHEIKDSKTKIHFHVGGFDEKYKNLYTSSNIKNVHFYPTSHRDILKHIDTIIESSYD